MNCNMAVADLEIMMLILELDAVVKVDNLVLFLKPTSRCPYVPFPTWWGRNVDRKKRTEWKKALFSVQQSHCLSYILISNSIGRKASTTKTTISKLFITLDIGLHSRNRIKSSGERRSGGNSSNEKCDGERLSCLTMHRFLQTPWKHHKTKCPETSAD